MSHFSPNYFDNNLRRVLGLKKYSAKHENVDKISEKQVSDLLLTGLKMTGYYRVNDRQTLLRTINDYFGGLARIRVLPLWKVHIDIAMAIFNNRLQLTTQNGETKNFKNDPTAITTELIIRYFGPQLTNYLGICELLKAEQSRKSKSCKIEDYKIACSLLPRIPVLDREDVKQICAFIIEWTTARYKIVLGKFNSIDEVDMMMKFNSNYNYEFVDLGPESAVLNDLQMTEDILVQLYQVWETIDDDLPILNPHLVNHRLLVPEKNNEGEKEQPVVEQLPRSNRSHCRPRYLFETEEYQQPRAKSRRSQQHPRYKNESDEEEVLTQVDLNQPSLLSRSKRQSRFHNGANSNQFPATMIIPSLQLSNDHTHHSSREMSPENLENLEGNGNLSLTEQAAILQRRFEHVTRVTKQIDMREGELTEREKTLNQLHDEIMKQMAELKEKKKKIKEREESLNDREKSQNEREKLQNKRERFQNDQQKLHYKPQSLLREVSENTEMDCETTVDFGFADDEDDSSNIKELKKNKRLKKKKQVEKNFYSRKTSE